VADRSEPNGWFDLKTPDARSTDGTDGNFGNFGNFGNMPAGRVTAGLCPICCVADIAEVSLAP